MKRKIITRQQSLVEWTTFPGKGWVGNVAVGVGEGGGNVMKGWRGMKGSVVG